MKKLKQVLKAENINGVRAHQLFRRVEELEKENEQLKAALSAVQHSIWQMEWLFAGSMLQLKRKLASLENFVNPVIFVRVL